MNGCEGFDSAEGAQEHSHHLRRRYPRIVTSIRHERDATGHSAPGVFRERQTAADTGMLAAGYAWIARRSPSVRYFVAFSNVSTTFWGCNATTTVAAGAGGAPRKIASISSRVRTGQMS